MYPELKGKTALITGAGRRTGIGFAIADKLASCGANVIIADLGLAPDISGMAKAGGWEEMEEIAETLRGQCSVDTLAVDLDVTSNDSIARAFARIKERFDRLDILCNNAGASFGVPSAIHTYDEAAWLKTIDINLHGVYRVSKAAESASAPSTTIFRRFLRRLWTASLRRRSTSRQLRSGSVARRRSL